MFTQRVERKVKIDSCKFAIFKFTFVCVSSVAAFPQNVFAH